MATAKAATTMAMAHAPLTLFDDRSSLLHFPGENTTFRIDTCAAEEKKKVRYSLPGFFKAADACTDSLSPILYRLSALIMATDR